MSVMGARHMNYFNLLTLMASRRGTVLDALQLRWEWKVAA